MSRDKSLCSASRSATSADLVQSGIFVLQTSTPAAPFTIADAAGRWDLFSLQSRNERGNIGEWLAGNITVDRKRAHHRARSRAPAASRRHRRPCGDAIEPLRVSPTGLVSATIVTEVRVLELRGAMNADKDRDLWSRRSPPDHRPTSIPLLALFALSRPDGPPAKPSIVQFRRTATPCGSREGATATLIVERTGAYRRPR